MIDVHESLMADKEVEAAKNLYNYAGARLERAAANHRYAHLVLHRDHAILKEFDDKTKDAALHIARYVLFGRTDKINKEK